jgi:cellulose synthase operon protein YhjU
MIFWYLYLLTAAVLSFSGYIILDIFLTAALAVVVHLLPRFTPSKSRVIAGLKVFAVAAAASALLWRASYLPPVSKLITFAANAATRPSPAYILGFIRQFLNFQMILAGAGLFAAAAFAYRKAPRVFVVSVYFVFAAAWTMQPAQHIGDMGGATPEAFYKNESGRIVRFSAPAKNSPPFDIILLHVCSLSWQDIKDSGSDLTGFFSKFDYVFTGFNAAGSSSGPAALRLLKSPCGQTPLGRLYAGAPADCYLLDKLRDSGFKTYTVFNHTGRYGDFSVSLQRDGHADAPLSLSGLSAAYQMFDGTFLYADNEALHEFWKVRADSGAPRAVLYYNTADLHSGTHKPGVSRRPDDAASYRERLVEMTVQLEEFFSEVKSSGRNVVVVFVPEHGAALSWTKMQSKGLREIPLPSITLVPVAVKLIGKNFYAGALKPRIITKPAGTQALAWLIAEFLRHNPYTRDAREPGIIASEIPSTDFLAENDKAAVMRAGSGYIYRLNWKNGGRWVPLPDYAGTRPGTIPLPRDFNGNKRP